MRQRLKMRKLRTVAALTLITALTACEGATPELSNDALISTPQGPVQGVTTDNPDIFNFKGLPFAAPPLGELRWAPLNRPQLGLKPARRTTLAIAVCK